MKIAITGGSGRIGRAIIEHGPGARPQVVSIDRVDAGGAEHARRRLCRQAEIDRLRRLVAAFAGCDAVIHMAAIPSPCQHPDHVVHNNNVVGSYNALRAAVENGIMRICQASSVNAIGLAYQPRRRISTISRSTRSTPTTREEPYGLSKWICEQQADSFARRYEGIRIASMRFHWVVAGSRRWRPSSSTRPTGHRKTPVGLHPARAGGAGVPAWRSTASSPATRRSTSSPPTRPTAIPSLELAATYHPGVQIRGDLSGNRSFFSSSKAERLLGWRHDD